MNMVISPTDFMYEGFVYFQDSFSGRCYRPVEPSGNRGKAARKGLPVNKRASLAHCHECRAACLKKVEGGAA
jgi:hypothetical protein